MSRRTTVLACLITSTLFTLVATPAHAATSHSNVDYVALGDSYSSGVGAPGQSGSCLRGSSGYPAQWAANNDPASFRNVACSGATTDDVLQSQVSALTSGTDLVTITIGGNDGGFLPNLVSCILSTDAACAASVATAHDDAARVLPGKLDAAYAAIRAHAPNATVVVLSYPVLFDTSTADCGIGGVSLAKRRTLNANSADLEVLVKQRALAAGFRYADVRPGFAGHGVCSKNPWINGITAVPITNSFHPNATGYTDGYLPALNAALG
jgi:lysophospholipase L1-like esterase